MPPSQFTYPFASGPSNSSSVPQNGPRKSRHARPQYFNNVPPPPTRPLVPVNKFRNIQQQYFNAPPSTSKPAQQSGPRDDTPSSLLPGHQYRSNNIHAALVEGPSPKPGSNSNLNAVGPFSDILRITLTGQLQKSPYLDAELRQNRKSITNKFSLPADPYTWGSAITGPDLEPDDYLHNPDPRYDIDTSNVISCRGFSNVGCMLLLLIILLGLFIGYPVAFHFTRHQLKTLGGFNLGGINSTGQIPAFPGHRGLIDIDTPHTAREFPSYVDGSMLQLVFSDEFNVDGRTFYAGDDPYWEAVDLHYWQTRNMEWYSPEAVTTKNGFLQITLSEQPLHDLNYTGGMVSTWNKLCFTGGLIQTSVLLPGVNNVMGLWPAVWTMGNLGRAGYGASLEGTWPYTYDACDVGTAPNQTKNGLPLAATMGGDTSQGGALSYLPGQKLSRCTCPGEAHPGPLHPDGSFVGRAAPEIDVLEAQITGEPPIGSVSQSAQWAPFNAGYVWFNTTENLDIANYSISALNSYIGGAYQQATSSVTVTSQLCYEKEKGCFEVYGFEYRPGFDNGYIAWVMSGKRSWTIHSSGMGADTRVEISARPIPQEPMYIIVNLGISTNFGDVDIVHLTFPTIFSVDWIRVYQRPEAINIGCDPEDFPTAAYIERFKEAYTDPNLTTWRDDYAQPFPKNRFMGEC